MFSNLTTRKIATAATDFSFSIGCCQNDLYGFFHALEHVFYFTKQPKIFAAQKIHFFFLEKKNGFKNPKIFFCGPKYFGAQGWGKQQTESVKWETESGKWNKSIVRPRYFTVTFIF